MLTDLNDLGIDIVTEVINKIYDSGEIPENIITSFLL